MCRPLRLACFLPLLLVIAGPATAQVDFGDVDLGEIDTQCFTLCFGEEGCNESGTVLPLAVEPPFFIRNARIGAFDDNPCANPQDTERVQFPVELEPGEAVAVDIDLVATEAGDAAGTVLLGENPILGVEARVFPAPPCSPSDPETLCLRDERFAVRVQWRDFANVTGPAIKVPGVQSPDSGLFYFFQPDNWEMLIKVIDACSFTETFWVFYAATTNVEMTITVTDTEGESVRTYFNPLGETAPPIQDVEAFATCQ